MDSSSVDYYFYEKDWYLSSLYFLHATECQ